MAYQLLWQVGQRTAREHQPVNRLGRAADIG